MTSSTDIAASHPLLAFGRVGEHLAKAFARRRLAPSYLLEGADAATLESAARVIAACIVAGSPPAAPEGRTYALALSGSHADVHRLERDKPTVISVAALTRVLERANAAPLEGEHQVFIVSPADAMEPAGIARYLKTLEEPPSGTVFLLLTTRAERLPDTVLSRCQRLRFPPLDRRDVERRLVEDGADEYEAARASAACAGSLTRAQRMASAGVFELVDTALRAAVEEPAAVARAAEAVRAAVEKRAKEQPADGVDRGREVVRDLLEDWLFALSVEARERAAGRQSVLAETVSASAALQLIERLGEGAVAVRRNVTPAVIILDALACLRSLSRPR